MSSPSAPATAFPPAGGKHLRPVALLLVLMGVYATVLLWSLGAAPVHRTAEVRVERVTQGMLASGDWLVPRLQAGEARLQKPPLYYWLATASSALLGADRFALRLPAALASLALLPLAFAWGRSVADARAGLLAAACLACMPGLLQFGRLGVAETLLAASSTLALAAFAADLAAGRPPGWLFAAGFGLALLSKATVALLVVALPVVLLLLLARSTQPKPWRRLLLLMLVALLPAAAWYAVVLTEVPGGARSVFSFALLPFGVRLPEAAGNASHIRPVWYHVAQLPRLCAAVLPFLPLVAWRAWRTRGWRDRPGLRVAALAVAAPFVVFSLLPEKQDHYLLPLLAPLGLLVGDTLGDLADRVPRPGWRLAALVALAAFALAGLGVLAGTWKTRTNLLPLCVAGAVVLLLLVAWLLRQVLRARVRPFVAGLAAGSLACSLLWFSVIDLELQRHAASEDPADAEASAGPVVTQPELAGVAPLAVPGSP